MDVFDLYAAIKLRTDDYENSLGKAKSSFEKAGETIKKAVSTIAKVSTAAVSAASTGIAAIVKNSVDSYANYEQLVGGVETLFKGSADKVQAYADAAYKTAGLSANEYMDTVTSFSASLIQSTGGDTEKAAELANQAIIDMSDNANKMGTSMDMIQNAYQGFAKQNYTMLDNLKLGYGGTEEEMERLLDDAEKLPGALGRDFDISSYGDVVEAIHLVQENMGIAGTTSKEAASTIEGSVGSMKAAWQNLVTEIAKGDGDISGKIDEFVASAEPAFDMVLQRFEKSLDGIGQLVEKAAPIISAKLPGVVRKILPSLLKNGTQLVSSLASALIQSIPGVVSDLVDAVVESFGLTSQWNSLKDKLSPIVESFESIGSDIFDTVSEIGSTIAGILGSIDFSAMIESFSGLLASIEPIVSTIGDTLEWLVDNVLAPYLTFVAESSLPAFFDLLASAANLLQAAFEALEPTATTIWENFLKPLGEWAGDAVVALFEKLADALNAIAGDPQMVEHLTNIAVAIAAIKVTESSITSIRKMGTEIGKLISNVKNAISSMSTLGKAGTLIGTAIASWEIGTMIYEQFGDKIDEYLYPVFDFFVNLWNTIVEFFTESIPEFFGNIGEWCSNLWDNITGIFSDIGTWFSDLFSSAAEGVQAAWDGVTGFFSGIWEGIVNIFSTVGEWFSSVFTFAVDCVMTSWSVITGFFSGIWNGITSIFSTVGTWFSDKFNAAVDGIKSVFSRVKDFFVGVWDGIKTVFGGVADWFKSVFDKALAVIKAPLNAIIDGINWVINGLNGISFDVPDWVPGVGGKSFGFNIGNIPRLAKGGVVNDPTMALIGEQGREAIVPLENNLEWIDKIAEKLRSGIPASSGIIIENINVSVTESEGMDIGHEIAEKIAEKLEEIERMQYISRGVTR